MPKFDLNLVSRNMEENDFAININEISSARPMVKEINKLKRLKGFRAEQNSDLTSQNTIENDFAMIV